MPAIVAAQWSVGSLAAFDLPGGRLIDIITGILTFLLAIIGIISIIGFVVAGILYLTSAGDEDQIKRAKRAMNYSIIGVIVALAGYVAIIAAEDLLWGDLVY